MRDGDELFEQVRLYLPKYLTPSDAKQLWSELSGFPENKNFYLVSKELEDTVLQGDGWRGFVVLDFETGAKRTVSGVILSNSCDISIENRRVLPFNILFSPLIELEKFEARLRTRGQTPVQVQGLLTDVRRQRVSNIFYLPEWPDLVKESAILLDNIHVHPAADFLGRERTALFTLNQYAFYLLLMKLSIHFSRFQEGIRRFGPVR